MYHDELVRIIGEERRRAALQWRSRARTRAAPRLGVRMATLWGRLRRRPATAVTVPVSLPVNRAEAAGAECCAAESPAA